MALIGMESQPRNANDKKGNHLEIIDLKNKISEI